jgi:integrase
MNINTPNNVRQRKNGSYEIRISVGYDSKGKQIRKSKYWRPDKNMTARQNEKDLKEQALLFEQNCKRKTATTKALKFEEVAEKWLDVAETYLSENTIKRYSGFIPRINKAIGFIRIDNVKPDDIQDFITALVKKGKHQRTGEPLSRSTIALHLNVISNVFNYAIDKKMITENPCERIKLPPKDTVEMEIYSVEEMQEILYALCESDNYKLKMFINLAVASGLRCGELLGLIWDTDVDFEKNLITVRRSSHGNQESKQKKSKERTKTPKSRRTVDIAQDVMDMLAEFKAEQDKERESMRNQWTNSDRIFTGLTGKPLCPTLPYKWFEKFCEKNGFRFCNLHSFRHFNASAMLDVGINIVEIKERFGHTELTTTSKYCQRLRSAYQKRHGEAITSVISFKGKRKAPLGVKQGVKIENPEKENLQTLL